MKLDRNKPGWAERLIATVPPALTLASAVPAHLAGLPRVRELAKIHFRALLHPRQTADWLHLLNSHPAFSEYVKIYPKFVYKVFRPYNSLALSPDERLDAIRAHYMVIFRRGLGQTVARASVGPVVLTEVGGKNGSIYEVQLHTLTTFDREGELALQLAQDGKVICTVAFTVAPRAGIPAVSVGCIQGGKTEDAREAIRTATRELHGLRPKQLMVSLVRQLGYDLGCSRIVMVSNRNRVIYKAIKNGHVLANYDTLWQEMGASQRPDGDFELPCMPIAAPKLEAMPSKKRSEARRRHALLAQLAEGVSVSLRTRPAANVLVAT